MSTLRQPERSSPSWSSWSVLIVGLLATGASTFVLGQLFSWPFGLMVGFGVAAIAACVGWGVAHPPDPFDD